MNEIRILIADDSVLFSKFLKSVVDSAEGFTCISCAGNAFDARDEIEKLRPDMLILDIEMPKMNGIAFLRQLIPQYTVPVIVCSSRKDLILQAMQAGAADFLPKPEEGGYDEFKQKLLKSLRAAANIRRVKSGCKFYNIRNSAIKQLPDQGNTRKLIAIGGSAGSTEALPAILSALDKSSPPVAVVLHMPEGYTSLYAKRMDKAFPQLNIVEATHGLYLENGMVVIAQGDKHMRLFKDAKGYFVTCEFGPKVSGHCPSVDVFFESVAFCAGDEAIGVILTGMGKDGARGMSQMRHAGAYTIGQNEKTSAVYGMPKAAFELGAVIKQCDLERIGAVINSHLKK
ncbi:MAG: chemotaxis-specific protein-glutamate methyltransferase CheB [Ruminococcus sp.]|nr:chemotaxis-specific protein-glutamate methyltransferase CheB [Ruminococcus sp.]